MHQSKWNQKYQAGQFVVAATDIHPTKGCLCVCVFVDGRNKYRILQTIRSPPPSKILYKILLLSYSQEYVQRKFRTIYSETHILTKKFCDPQNN
jgi:hypothetical protein